MENYKSIKESYPDDDADILQLKNSLDCLYKILKKFYFNENYFKSLHISSFGGTPPHLFEVLNDSSDMYFSKEILEDSNDEIPEDCSLFYELQDKVKQLYLHGFDKINVVDDIFLKIYGYDELLLKGFLNEIVDKTQEIKDNLDLYISRKLDNGIVDKWDELLNDFTSGDNVPIEKRGAGVRRLCSLFSYVVDVYRNMSVRQVPTIFAIDEVELSLHPNQQRQFIKVLNKLSEDFQFIITTHSPYVLSELKSENIQILKKNKKGEVVPNPMSESVIKGYVSISEINYIAFGEPSIEYHIELYGYIQNKLNKNVSEVDEWLKNTCNVPARCKWFIVNKNRPQVHLTQDPCPRTLPYCVRNNIDHPLNDDATNPRQNRAYNNNKDYASLENIKKSIKIMREAIKRNNL